MKITYSTFSEKGPRRENQDFIQTIIDENKGKYTFVLCDGMGGHAHGGLAARIVATSIARDIKQNPPFGKTGIDAMISRAMWTLDTMADVYGGAKMGTTMVMAYNIYYSVWGGVVNELIAIVSAVIGLYRFKKK